ncbi:MAG: NAD(P)H-hydrate dehydratase [Oligoflexia bacterium]|nr:NAD(P)H-hydrate dehydratase [Oligoflexia bacterium]
MPMPIQMRVVDAQLMREIEKRASDNYGLTESLIIENVGFEGSLLIDKIIKKHFKINQNITVAFVVGKGNNGADGMSIARHLLNNHGDNYRNNLFVYTLYPLEECSSELQRTLKMAASYGVKIRDELSHLKSNSNIETKETKIVVIDAILGTGVRHPLPPLLENAFKIINNCSDLTISVDIPSGVHGDSGKVVSDSVNAAVRANYTLAIGTYKVGHFFSQGLKYKGKLLRLRAGFADELFYVNKESDKDSNKDSNKDSEQLVIEKVAEQEIKKYIKQNLILRNQYAHKNDYGHLLIIGGGRGLSGAAHLAADAASKVGTGLVTIATYKENFLELNQHKSKNIMIREIGSICENNLDLDHDEINKKFSSVIIGPGLGSELKNKQLNKKLLEELILNFQGPLIIDADAINLLSFNDQTDMKLIKSRFDRGWITLMTPHLGEFARFIGVDKGVMENDLLAFFINTLERINFFVLVKSSALYLLGNKNISIYHSANSGLAKAGTGDVLVGILGGICAQKFNFREGLSDPSSSVKIILSGVYIHSLAAKFAARTFSENSLSPLDIINNLSNVFLKLSDARQCI